MNPPAFFAEHIPGIGEMVRLNREESHHAIAVLRLRVGAEIVLLDGSGSLGRARVNAIGAAFVECEVLERDAGPPQLPRLHVASALPKGERQNVLLDMATQLGMASYTPLICARSVATASGKSQTRWERICRSACKQALVRYRPELRAAALPDDFVRTLCAGGAVVFLADRSGTAPLRVAPAVQDLGLIVGPEGGFTDDERSAMVAAGARPWRLAPNVLRVEAAVVTGLAVLRHCCGTD